MKPHQSGGEDYSKIPPCGHLCGSTTPEEAHRVLDSVNVKPCKHINIKEERRYIHRHASATQSLCLGLCGGEAGIQGGKLHRT